MSNEQNSVIDQNSTINEPTLVIGQSGKTNVETKFADRVDFNKVRIYFILSVILVIACSFFVWRTWFRTGSQPVGTNNGIQSVAENMAVSNEAGLIKIRYAYDYGLDTLEMLKSNEGALDGEEAVSPLEIIITDPQEVADLVGLFTQTYVAYDPALSDEMWVMLPSNYEVTFPDHSVLTFDQDQSSIMEYIDAKTNKSEFLEQSMFAGKIVEIVERELERLANVGPTNSLTITDASGQQVTVTNQDEIERVLERCRFAEIPSDLTDEQAYMVDLNNGQKFTVDYIFGFFEDQTNNSLRWVKFLDYCEGAVELVFQNYREKKSLLEAKTLQVRFEDQWLQINNPEDIQFVIDGLREVPVRYYPYLQNEITTAIQFASDPDYVVVFLDDNLVRFHKDTHIINDSIRFADGVMAGLSFSKEVENYLRGLVGVELKE